MAEAAAAAAAAAAKKRLGAVEKHLQPVKTVAAPSTSPRVQDKVVIVTGKLLVLLDSLCGRNLTPSPKIQEQTRP